jgi:hypothetical protein
MDQINKEINKYNAKVVAKEGQCHEVGPIIG